MSRNRREYVACSLCGVRFREPIQGYANLLCEDCVHADEAPQAGAGGAAPMRASGPPVPGGTTLTEKK